MSQPMSRPIALPSVIPAAASAASSAARALRAAVRARLGLWTAVARERRALARLDARLLRDIGLHAGEAAREADRPFWDPPSRRR
jgi:uncharacterized protein YjiS (DUF1127 family)